MYCRSTAVPDPAGSDPARRGSGGGLGCSGTAGDRGLTSCLRQGVTGALGAYASSLRFLDPAKLLQDLLAVSHAPKVRTLGALINYFK